MPTLDWIGKKAVVNHHRQVPYRLLHCDNKTNSIIRDPMGIYRAFSILLILIILPPMAGCGTQTSKEEFLSEGTIEDYLLRDSGCLMKDHQRFG